MINRSKPPDKDELQIKKEKIKQGLEKLKERTIKYDTLQQQLNNTTDKQISTTDADSRSILITKSIVEVAYNVQNVVDDKHNLVAQTEATNTNDGKALHKAATQAKQNLQLQKADTIMLLADKGYHTGAELQYCQQDNMITHVAYKEQPSVKHIDTEFLSESFDYHKATDSMKSVIIFQIEFLLASKSALFFQSPTLSIASSIIVFQPLSRLLFFVFLMSSISLLVKPSGV